MTGPTRKKRARSAGTLFRALLFLAIMIAFPGILPALADASPSEHKPALFFFWGIGCPTCETAKPFVEYLKGNYPGVRISSLEVVQNRENLNLMEKLLRERGAESGGVPVFIIGKNVFTGFNNTMTRVIEEALRDEIALKGQGGAASTRPPPRKGPETISLPFFGERETASFSLPVFTVAVAALDSFNPCAFFVLLTLLSLLVHAHSRRRMLLIGGVFVSVSGILYFFFMTAWMNLFFVVGHLSVVTRVAGITALAIAVINIKDYFLFKKGISLNIPEKSKPKLFERMRGLMRAESLPSALTGTIILAVAANSYELLCTAGFPMVYTRFLTMHSLSTAGYYAYLALYNLVYVIPLAIIVSFFVITMGSRKLSEWQGRVMKLVSGMMMCGLALVLLLKPELLQDVKASVLLFMGVVIASALIVMVTGKRLRARQATGRG